MHFDYVCIALLHTISLRKRQVDSVKEIAIDTRELISDTLNYRLVALKRKKDGQMKKTTEKRTLSNSLLEWQPAGDKKHVRISMQCY